MIIVGFFSKEISLEDIFGVILVDPSGEWVETVMPQINKRFNCESTDIFWSNMYGFDDRIPC